MVDDIRELEEVGFKASRLDLKDYFGKKEELNKVFKTSPAFYVVGGNTFVLRKAMRLSGFDTISVANMQSMFEGCSSLTSLDLSTFDTSSVTTMYGMFSDCSSLTSLDLSTFDTSSVTSMSSMFYNCSSLTSLDFRLADFTTVTTYTNMFTRITSGITITVKDSNAQGWITTRLTDVGKTGNVVIA